MNPWADIEDARVPGLWPDAGTVDDVTLQDLLDSAYLTCLAYAPALPDASVPITYTQAVVMQAREGWQAFRRDGDVIGFDTYAVRVQPLTPRVRQLLRPARGVPVFSGGTDDAVIVP